ncbi:protein of unknown function [Pseudorhizobium banfieldiae]|uniref:Uncharacterized protein n=1 Tax=Pseudorhizobium banfieldiae TaxID=1125847 RepID=L0NHL1_9HYPH|nr:protein of unknown function [Pseudorhizobium banfieldiae]
MTLFGHNLNAADLTMLAFATVIALPASGRLVGRGMGSAVELHRDEIRKPKDKGWENEKDASVCHDWRSSPGRRLGCIRCHP